MMWLDQLAVKLSTGSGSGKVNIPTADPDALLQGVLTQVYTWGGIIAVIVIIIAGILYTTSGGDSGKIKIAKDAILYAVIGLIVIAMAFVITRFILFSVK